MGDIDFIVLQDSSLLDGNFALIASHFEASSMQTIEWSMACIFYYLYESNFSITNHPPRS